MSESRRRALKVRDKKWVNKVAEYISQKRITPNQISITSVFFALLAGACLLRFGVNQNLWLLVMAAVFVQFRLLCNLFDGLVAVEGGKSTPSGELFNDVPDRLADVMIIVPLGYVVNGFDYAIELGWLVGVLAVMTAYVRTLAVSMGSPTSYIGPMAKQHRMALVTFGCLLAALEFWVRGSYLSFYVVLWVLLLGTLITVYRRLRLAHAYLEKNHD